MNDAEKRIKNLVSYKMANQLLAKLLKNGLINALEYEKADRYCYERYDIDEIECEGIVGNKDNAPSHSPVNYENVNVSDDFLSLTDIIRQYGKDNPSYVIQSWLRGNNTIEFLNLWERENNPRYSIQGYEAFKEKIASASITITSKQWIEFTKSIGIKSKQGKNGGTYAHPIIACEFLAWLSPRFKLHLFEMRQLIRGKLLD